MSPGFTPILLLPGSWHGAWCWNEVIGYLVPDGRPALAVDMAGHGLRARRPECLTMRPFDPAALATEVSPVAAVDLDHAADLLGLQMKQLGRGGPVTVVAHSMGGPVLTRVAQQVPELVAHAVYVAAVMPASGNAPGPYFTLPENAEALVLSALRGDPDLIGALRLDLASNETNPSPDGCWPPRCKPATGPPQDWSRGPWWAPPGPRAGCRLTTVGRGIGSGRADPPAMPKPRGPRTPSGHPPGRLDELA
ncbi:alpha/beta fold hydrolase [Micromonospora sp. NPDC049559]|uniref:alpha/beta fold hydrolase n=1 Tax=Micromonospora sp. NPDC049559 TaxID=3155923 RepID=UPI0034416CD0